MASHLPNLGLRKVFPPSDSTDNTDNTTLDIIAIHGLDTRSPRTWEYKDSDRVVNWLSDRDMLPAIAPDARIYTYDWDANCFQNSVVQTLLGHSDNLLALVAGERVSTGRPIIFIASCFGGLLVAEAICRAGQEGSRYRDVLLSTVGIIFLATPFSGTNVTKYARWLVRINGIMGEESSDQLLKNLASEQDDVRQRIQRFAEIANSRSERLPFYCFFETRKTRPLSRILPRRIIEKLPLKGIILVPEDSACLDGCHRGSLSAAHSMMNKFSGPEDTNFISVRDSIAQLVVKGKLSDHTTATIPQQRHMLILPYHPYAATENLRNEGTRREEEESLRLGELRASLLKSLSFPAINARRTQLDDKPEYDGTFKWVLEEREAADGDHPKWDNFREWLQSKESAPYWILGKPGSGKSTLVHYIITHPDTKRLAIKGWSSNDTIILSHYFWRAGIEMQRNIKGLLCSLLHQLLSSRKDLVGSVLEGLEVDSSGHGTFPSEPSAWSNKKLENTLLLSLSRLPDPIYIFIDGLDELDDRDHDSLIGKIKKLASLRRIKVCIASRPDPLIETSIQQHLPACQRLRLQDVTYGDLEIYITAQLNDAMQAPDSTQMSEEEVRYLTYMLLLGADGVFLWVHLAVRNITKGIRACNLFAELKDRVEMLPRDIEGLYDEMWTRMNGDELDRYRSDAALYFQILLTLVSDNIPEELQNDTLSIMEIALVAEQREVGPEKSMITEILNAGKVPEGLQQRLDKLLKGAKTGVLVRSAGLLDLIEAEYYNEDSEPHLGPHFYYRGTCITPESPVPTQFVRFIHRTAYEFLLETTRGREILAFGPKQDDETIILDIAAAHLAILHVFNPSQRMIYSSYSDRIFATTHLSTLALVLDRLQGTPCLSNKDMTMRRVSDLFGQILQASCQDGLATFSNYATLYILDDLVQVPPECGFYVDIFFSMFRAKGITCLKSLAFTALKGLEGSPGANFIYCEILIVLVYNSLFSPDTLDDVDVALAAWLPDRIIYPSQELPRPRALNHEQFPESYPRTLSIVLLKYGILSRKIWRNQSDKRGLSFLGFFAKFAHHVDHFSRLHLYLSSGRGASEDTPPQEILSPAYDMEGRCEPPQALLVITASLGLDIFLDILRRDAPYLWSHPEGSGAVSLLESLLSPPKNQHNPEEGDSQIVWIETRQPFASPDTGEKGFLSLYDVAAENSQPLADLILKLFRQYGSPPAPELALELGNLITKACREARRKFVKGESVDPEIEMFWEETQAENQVEIRRVIEYRRKKDSEWDKAKYGKRERSMVKYFYQLDSGKFQRAWFPSRVDLLAIRDCRHPIDQSKRNWASRAGRIGSEVVG